MKTKIDTKNWNRNKQFEWFKNFSNATYSISKNVDITKLVNYSKINNKSFFICMMYIVIKSLNSIEQMRMRYENEEVYIYDNITPAYTVMTKNGEFENVRHAFSDNFKTFYDLASKNIEATKNQEKLSLDNYNPDNCYSEYYITSIPWINITSMEHPKNDNKSYASIPIVCWDKYRKLDDNYEIMINITANHMFVDGHPLAQTFIKIEELLNDVEEVLK